MLAHSRITKSRKQTRIEPYADLLRFDPIALLKEADQLTALTCDILSQISDDLWHSGREENAALAESFIGEVLPVLLEDERFSLLPSLCYRVNKTAIARELMKNVVVRLSQDHDRLKQLADTVIPGLQALSVCALPENTNYFVLAIIQLETLLQQHFVWRESFLIPLAQEYLTETDLDKIRHEMTVRRLSFRYE